MTDGRNPLIPILALALVAAGLLGGICAPVMADDGCRCTVRDTPAEADASGLGGDVPPSKVIASFETDFRSTVVAIAGPMGECPATSPPVSSVRVPRLRTIPDSVRLFLLHCSWLN